MRVAGRFAKQDSELHNFDDALVASVTWTGGGKHYAARLPAARRRRPVIVCVTLAKGRTAVTVDGQARGTVDVTFIDKRFFSSLSRLFLGVNRVIAASARLVSGGVGHGLCAATVTWQCWRLAGGDWFFRDCRFLKEYLDLCRVRAT